MDELLDKLNNKGKFIYLARNVQKETLGLCQRWFRGLFIKRHYKRWYPHGKIAAQILGYTNIDDQGISGIEKVYNIELAGAPGWVVKARAGKERCNNLVATKSITNRWTQYSVNIRPAISKHSPRRTPTTPIKNKSHQRPRYYN
ncbi:MAG: hypothetical protein Ct9H300mP29_4060 [Candidatus Neomarinimicrobiota bacterium]|nr:MAG: hypothetical protein Ct9H300mP29_4060 [Candidatus Neomarinimicrobiota bacterium]